MSARNPAASDHFLDEVEANVNLMAAFPEHGRPRDELRRGVRSFRLHRFPFILFYRTSNDEITLLRILHGARDQRRTPMES